MSLAPADLIAQFGYAAILIGTFLEGETILILAGFAAHQGLLRLDLAILCAFLGSAAGDQLWFALARHHGQRFLATRPGLAARIAPATRWLERYPTSFVLGFRFVYGIRNVAPIAIGLSAIPTRRFVLLNLCAAALWAGIFGSTGYYFGAAMETMLGDLKTMQLKILSGIALAVLAWFGLRWISKRFF